MKAFGCLLMLIIGVVLFVLMAGWKFISLLFNFKGSPFQMFRTMMDVRQNVKNMQEQMKQQQSDYQDKKEQAHEFGKQRHDETSQQRTDTTSPGTRKIIPDDEGEYVSYEEIKDKN